jgi:hypothetical protein
VKRFVGLAAVAAIAAAVLALPVAATPDDTKGKSCANYTSGFASYTIANGTGTVDANMTLAQPMCANVGYTLYVYTADAAGNIGSQIDVIQGTATANPDVVNFHDSFDASLAPYGVFIYAVTTKGNGGAIADRAPDTGYELVTPDFGGCCVNFG